MPPKVGAGAALGVTTGAGLAAGIEGAAASRGADEGEGEAAGTGSGPKVSRAGTVLVKGSASGSAGAKATNAAAPVSTTADSQLAVQLPAFQLVLSAPSTLAAKGGLKIRGRFGVCAFFAEKQV